MAKKSDEIESLKGLPGIGDVIATEMWEDDEKPVKTPAQLYGYFLIDEKNFKKFVRYYGADSEEREKCYDAMQQWKSEDESRLEKSLEDLPGIGVVIATEMREDGEKPVKTPAQLYGYFLINEDRFKKFVRSYGANKGEREKCLHAMQKFKKDGCYDPKV